MEPPKKSLHTAVWDDGKCFNHFGIHPKTASLYGHEPEEILEVELTVAEDQTKPPPLLTRDNADYWGWYDFKEKGFSHVYAQYFLLNMCFPYGLQISENAGEGKAYRVNVNKLYHDKGILF